MLSKRGNDLKKKPTLLLLYKRDKIVAHVIVILIWVEIFLL